ncbi:MAG: gamma-butyrobetaine hydroxylase-like domain-containing protein, partial [Burkholderiaceae bacterium]|nr:gamma-butyrobetaine hydroxylase-like domain-containing protein [Burkholderiaceae bacterium]
TLQVGKRDVTIERLEPVGQYAVQPFFSDGHSSGIYSWAYLYELGVNQQALWEDYLRRLEEVGASRDPADPRNAKFVQAGGPACGHH